jgi:hypothetical protein
MIQSLYDKLNSSPLVIAKDGRNIGIKFEESKESFTE